MKTLVYFLKQAFTDKVRSWIDQVDNKQSDQPFRIYVRHKLLYALMETPYVESSFFYKFLIEELFEEQLPSDRNDIIFSKYTKDERPWLFENPDFSNPPELKEILSLPLTLKEKSNLFTTYTGPYYHDKDKLANIVERRLESQKVPRFPLYENYLGWFPDYFELMNETLSAITSDQSTLASAEVYYLAIIVVN